MVVEGERGRAVYVVRLRALWAEWVVSHNVRRRVEGGSDASADV